MFGKRISSGMAAEICKAETRGMPILSSTDFEEAERYLRAKYQPIFTAA